MFDDYARQLIDSLPNLPNIDRDACRRALSSAYFTVVQARLKLEGPPEALESLQETRLLLRRMADALESVAVFDRLNGLEVESRTEQASAFVAAEAVALLAALPDDSAPQPDDEEEDDTQKSARPSSDPPLGVTDDMQAPRHYVAIEAALLYLIAGYEVNAVALVKDLPRYIRKPAPNLREARRQNASYLLSRVQDFCMGRVTPPRNPVPYSGFAEPPIAYETAVEELRLLAYLQLSKAISAFLNWLGGYSETLVDATTLVDKVWKATRSQNVASVGEGPIVAEFVQADLADMHHLASLLKVAFENLSKRSLLHSIPPPDSGDAVFQHHFKAYLNWRVRGSQYERGRPYLWPSALDYIGSCLPGPNCDAVIAMPTGSGKSFVAELGIAYALGSGDVIYLAPTNALVHQIRRDLEKALEPFENVKVLAFIGAGEYTRLAEEEMAIPEGRFVAVLTPEKCALALRLTPTAFANAKLCVFDECHLLNDEHRGVIADLLIAQLFTAAPNMRFLLMSAMVANPIELADWLRRERRGQAIPSQINWRPSRTLRGLLVVNKESALPAFEAAHTKLRGLVAAKKSRKNVGFKAEMALVVGLSGPWTQDGALDYASVTLGSTLDAQASLESNDLKNHFLRARAKELAPAGAKLIYANFKTWKNPAARVLSEQFAIAGVPTINFILSSRHHAFSSAESVEGVIPGAGGIDADFPPLVEAWLSLADAEMGQSTALRGLLQRGVAVHTSALLQVEQAASEWMFTHGKAGLMFATGTLAQGLNLPAIAIVVAGTSMGDPREAKDADNVVGLGQKVDATILNGFGRAGRPGFSNQGIAVLVSDRPFSALIRSHLNADPALVEYPVLGMRDAAINVHSPIERVLDRMFIEGDQFTAATATELELVTQLAESPIDGDHAGEVLRRTFAGFRRGEAFDANMTLRVRDRIETLKQAFLEQPDVPPWLNRAAMEAGVDILRAQRIWFAYTHNGTYSLEESAGFTLENWFAILLQTMKTLPPARVSAYFADEEIKSTNILTRLRDSALPLVGVDAIPWNQPDDWEGLWNELEVLISLWLGGGTYTQLAQEFLKDENIAPDRTSGKPLPTIFGFIRKVMEPLATDAGCLAALLENSWKAEHGPETSAPLALQSLPLCIRVGCGTLDSLSWFRFGYRQRAAAHALARSFPVPPNIISDTDRAQWVRMRLAQWLDGDVTANDDPLLPFIETIIKEANL